MKLRVKRDISDKKLAERYNSKGTSTIGINPGERKQSKQIGIIRHREYNMSLFIRFVGRGILNKPSEESSEDKDEVIR